MLLEILSNQSQHYQKCHQADVGIDHLGIRECLTSDCRKCHVVPAHPCKKFLFHNHSVLVVRHKWNTRKPGFEPDIPDRQCRITAWSRFPKPFLHTPCSYHIKRLQMFRSCYYLSPWQDSNLRPAFVLHAIRSCQLSYTAYHIYLSSSRLMQVPNPA